MMLKLRLGAMVASCISLAGCSPSESSAGAAAPTRNWCQGGTLHQKTAADWVAAPPEDRLATASDFVAKLSAPKSIAELRSRTDAMERCITTAAPAGARTNQTFIQLAGACGALPGYPPPK